MLEAFFQEYLIVPTAHVTVHRTRAGSKQEASVLVEVAKAKAAAGDLQ
jgi:hypothetical protein